MGTGKLLGQPDICLVPGAYGPFGLCSGQKVKGGVGWRNRVLSLQVLSLPKGMSHPIFEPVEG